MAYLRRSILRVIMILAALSIELDFIWFFSLIWVFMRIRGFLLWHGLLLISDIRRKNK